MNRKLDTHEQLLLGPSGTLPAHYNDAVLNQLKDSKSSLLDFYAIFNKRASDLIHSAHESSKIIKLNFLGNNPKFFFYSGLHAFNLRSKQSLKQFISSYFDFECREIELLPLRIKLKSGEQSLLSRGISLNSLGEDARLGRIVKTNSLQLVCYFERLDYIHYNALILNPNFLKLLHEIIQLYLIGGCYFKLCFELSFESNWQACLNDVHLGWNTWLGSISTKQCKHTTLSFQINTDPKTTRGII